MKYIAMVNGAAGQEIIGVFSTDYFAISAAREASVVDCRSRAVWEISTTSARRIWHTPRPTLNNSDMWVWSV